MRSRTSALITLAFVALLCDACTTQDPPVPASAAPTTLDQLRSATVAPIRADEVAEILALGGRATDLQRADLTARLIGAVVEWDLQVYDVTETAGDYEITSQALPSGDPNAVSLMSIVARVHPTSAAEVDRLHALRTDDQIRVRGLAQGIFLRSVVRLEPAMLSAN